MPRHGPDWSVGASRVAEALAAVMATEGLAELAHVVGAEAGYRRIGSISKALSLRVGHGLEPEPWRTLVDLDTTVTSMITDGLTEPGASRGPTRFPTSRRWSPRDRQRRHYQTRQ